MKKEKQPETTASIVARIKEGIAVQVKRKLAGHKSYYTKLINNARIESERKAYLLGQERYLSARRDEIIEQFGKELSKMIAESLEAYKQSNRKAVVNK